MKAHDLARALLAGPNVEVAVHHPKIPDWATKVRLQPQPMTYYRYPEEDDQQPTKIEIQALVLDDEDFALQPDLWPEFDREYRGR